MAKIGIIGGSGLEKLDMFRLKEEFHIETPYGKPSSSIYSGALSGTEVFILSRHDREHTIPPTHVNNLANIYAFKTLGCEFILATVACGSLREEIHPGDLVIPDQFIDFTRNRKVSFFDHFEKDNVMHVAMPDPFSQVIRKCFKNVCDSYKIPVHNSGTIITIEGSRFSTRAESKMFRIWGADLVNMSVAPEAILANEIGIPYAVMAMSTDYDSWRDHDATVTWDEILKVFKINTEKITQVLLGTIDLLGNQDNS